MRSKIRRFALWLMGIVVLILVFLMVLGVCQRFHLVSFPFDYIAAVVLATAIPRFFVRFSVWFYGCIFFVLGPILSYSAMSFEESFREVYYRDRPPEHTLGWGLFFVLVLCCPVLSVFTAAALDHVRRFRSGTVAKPRE